jgi:Spy/CpxP family protein refolding chaperone
MDKEEENKLLGLIVLPITVEANNEGRSGIDATVLSYIKENITPDVNAPTPADYPPSAKNGFEDYYSGIELSDEQKQQMAEVAVKGTSLTDEQKQQMAKVAVKGTSLTDEQKQQMAEVAVKGTSLILSKLNDRKKDEYRQALLSHCGRKPLIGRKKRQKYFECVTNYNKQVAEKEKIASMPTPATTAPTKKDWYKNPFVIVGGIAGLSLLGFYAYKTIKTKKS